MRSKGSRRRICPHRLAGARKYLRAARLLDFFDRCGEGDSIYNLYIKMRRRHLESVRICGAVRTMFTSFVSSRSLSVRGSWGTVPSVFWYGAPGGTQGPLGKGGAAERWRAVYPIGLVTRHGTKPATTHTSKRNAPAASRTGFASGKINAPPLDDHKLSPPGRRTN